jgi:hypothetical protein
MIQKQGSRKKNRKRNKVRKTNIKRIERIPLTEGLVSDYFSNHYSKPEGFFFAHELMHLEWDQFIKWVEVREDRKGSAYHEDKAAIFEAFVREFSKRISRFLYKIFSERLNGRILIEKLLGKPSPGLSPPLALA